MMTTTDVLLVEDHPRDAELALRALKRGGVAGTLLHAKDGEEALNFLFGHGRSAGRDPSTPPRLVMLDSKLPKIEGLEVLRAIRADPRTRETPVVVLTSSAEECAVIKTYRLGVNSFIVKPVEFEPFSEAVSQLGLDWLLLNRAPPRGGLEA